MVNYYHILGLSQTATQAEIKAAYRKLALRYHPDKNDGNSYAEERFKQINEAYQTLSNPRKKSRHDWSLEYEQHQQVFQAPQAQPAQARQQRRRRPRPPHARQQPSPQFNSRQNVVATAWAFAIFFLVALLVVGISLWNSYNLEQKEVQQNQEALQAFLEAEQSFDQGNYSLTFQLIKPLMNNKTMAPKATQLREQVLDSMEAEGLRSFQQGNFRQATEVLQLLADQAQEYRPTALAHLVASYEALQDYEGAIRGYKSVIRAEPRTIEARNRLARIYAEQYKDFQTALQYYQQASELVIDQYKSEYGKAYPLVVNPASTPESHYQLHSGIAQVYISQGRLAEAEAALKWAIFLRPEDPLAYYLMGIKYREEKDLEKACSAWKEALARGSQQAADYLAEYCR